jgi:hypothetical protein
MDQVRREERALRFLETLFCGVMMDIDLHLLRRWLTKQAGWLKYHQENQNRSYLIVLDHCCPSPIGIHHLNLELG